MNSFKISGVIRDVKRVHGSTLEVTIENRQVLDVRESRTFYDKKYRIQNSQVQVGKEEQTNFYKVSFLNRYIFLPSYSSMLVVGVEIEVEGHLSLLATYEDPSYDSVHTKKRFVEFLATSCRVKE